MIRIIFNIFNVYIPSIIVLYRKPYLGIQNGLVRTVCFRQSIFIIFSFFFGNNCVFNYDMTLFHLSDVNCKISIEISLSDSTCW